MAIENPMTGGVEPTPPERNIPQSTEGKSVDEKTRAMFERVREVRGMRRRRNGLFDYLATQTGPATARTIMTNSLGFNEVAGYIVPIPEIDVNRQTQDLDSTSGTYLVAMRYEDSARILVVGPANDSDETREAMQALSPTPEPYILEEREPVAGFISRLGAFSAISCLTDDKLNDISLERRLDKIIKLTTDAILYQNVKLADAIGEPDPTDDGSRDVVDLIQGVESYLVFADNLQTLSAPEGDQTQDLFVEDILKDRPENT